MAFKIERKEMYPAPLFSCCWSVHSIKVVTVGKHAHSKEKPLPHNFCGQVYVHVLLVPHL